MGFEEILPEKPDDSRKPAWLPYLVFLIITAALAIPLLKNLNNWGIRDWDLFTTLHAAAVRSILDFGQFPFWNPYIGGGNILFAHPEVPVLNPLFGLLLLWGPLVGLKIQVLIVYLIGFIGCYKLARKIGIGYWGAWFPPLVYMLSSYLTLHFAAGHIPFHYFSALPWLIFFYKKSLEHPIHILSAGGVVAFIILGSGAAVPLLFSLFILFLFSLFDINRERTFWPPLFAIGSGICGILFGAVKFFPMYDYLTRYPWIPEGTVQTTPVSVLPNMFFRFDQSIFSDYIQGYVWGWHEYGAFIGPIAAILALIGLIIRFRRAWPNLVLIVISLTLVFGSFYPPFSPWDLLHKLPGFESIRVPSRFSILAILAIALLSGWGVDSLQRFFKHRRTAFVAVVFAAILGTHLFVCWPILGNIFTRSPETVTYNENFKQTNGDPNRMYKSFLANRGTIRAAWLSAYRPGRGILDYENKLHEWYSEGDRVTVLNREFSPNRISFDLRSKVAGKLVISQGYDTGWRIEGPGSGEIKPVSDLVSFDVEPGKSNVTIYYYPEYFTLGFWVSIITILAAIVLAPLYRYLWP